jgi:hypothetical protein
MPVLSEQNPTFSKPIVAYDWLLQKPVFVSLSLLYKRGPLEKAGRCMLVKRKRI